MTQELKRHGTEREVHQQFGVGIRQLRAMRMRGTGPGWVKVSGQLGKPGGRILYDLDAVSLWMRSRSHGGEAQDIDTKIQSAAQKLIDAAEAPARPTGIERRSPNPSIACVTDSTIRRVYAEDLIRAKERSSHRPIQRDR
jgi:hypothetical protein